MMPTDKSLESRFAEATRDLQDTLVPMVAKLMRPVPGNVNVKPEERQRRWWQEDKGWTPEKEQQLLAGGMSPEDVGILKYPNREIDARAFGGQNDERGQAVYARDMSAMGPPPPDPLEMTAQEIQSQEAGSQVQVPSHSPLRMVAGLPDVPGTTPPPGPGSPSAAAPEVHDYSSTQLDLPAPLASQVQALGQSIPDTDLLAEDGREDQPHVTVKYGLETDDPEAVREIVARHGPITVTLGKTSLFPAKKQDGGKPGDFDVVKLDVDSPELRALNAELSKLPNGNEHPTYTPHVTLAYVKPGMGEKYAGRTDLEGQKATIDGVTFSGKTGQKVVLPLTAARSAEPAPLTAPMTLPAPLVANGVPTNGGY